MSPQELRKTSGSQTSVLRELKFPLVFFGLCLLVTEAAFGAVLWHGNLSEKLLLAYGIMMTVVFLVTIGVVCFLTYAVPESLMLQPQSTLEMRRVVKETKRLSQISSAAKAQGLLDTEALSSALTSIESNLFSRAGSSKHEAEL
jgi:hypothetical protein